MLAKRPGRGGARLRGPSSAASSTLADKRRAGFATRVRSARSLLIAAALAVHFCVLRADRLLASETGAGKHVAPWTVIVYAGVDGSSEPYVMPHLAEVAQASRAGRCGEVVLLIDRVRGWSRDRRALGEDFTDTRLYRLGNGSWERIAGGYELPEITERSRYEADTSDPRTLQQFIRFAKRLFPSRRTALVLFGHGDGRSLCPDMTAAGGKRGDWLDGMFVGQLSQVLGVRETVDVLWLDACSMGGVENAYQFRVAPNRFSAKVLLATPPLSTPAPLADVLASCAIVGERAKPGAAVLDERSFGEAAIAAIETGLRERDSRKVLVSFEAWGCYDLTKVAAVKQAVDALAVTLGEGADRAAVEDVRGWVGNVWTMNYAFPRHPRLWAVSPFVDLFDLARRLEQCERLSQSTRDAAANVARATDEMVIASVGMSRYDGFEPGRHGLYVVFPGASPLDEGQPVWNGMSWYHPDVRQGVHSFGGYDWCRDGAVPGNGAVENWFELLDAWFDDGTDSGGVNGYRN